MCGFVGVFSDNINKFRIKEAGNTILHRGPDMNNFRRGENWAVSFNRLSIHDLSVNGMQPFSHDMVTIYMNGEIYNFRELKQKYLNEFYFKSNSDTEIVAFLYRKFGLDFINLLNGMFAIIIIDEKNNEKYLIRDRFGQKPLFYIIKNNDILFSSEIKSLFYLTDIQPDKQNIGINLLCWLLPQPLTLYKDVYSVQPGSLIKYGKFGIKKERWYEPQISTTKLSESDIEEEFMSKFKKSINYRLSGDVPVGVFLSGGLDSVSIAKYSAELISDKFYGFTANISDKDKFENNNTDIIIPRRISKDLNINNFEKKVDFTYYNQNIVKIIRNYDQIFLNSGVLVFYALSELADKNNVRVLLNGIGGDEIFGGYPWQSKMKRLNPYVFAKLVNQSKAPYSFYAKNIKPSLHSKIDRNLSLHIFPRVYHALSLGVNIPAINSKEIYKSFTKIDSLAKDFWIDSQKIIKGDINNQINFSNIYTVLSSQNYFSDISTMRYSLEGRSPFLDVELFEFMMSVPDHVKVRYGQKGFFRKIMSQHLPEYVTTAKKSGPTMPTNIWFNDVSLRKNVIKFILCNIDLIGEYISENLAYQIKKNCNVLIEKRSMPLFAIISFILWANINILNSGYDDEQSLTDILKIKSSVCD